MMLLTLCAVALTQAPAPSENESDRIREEIEAKWGSLTKNLSSPKELKITQIVYSTGVVSDSDRNAARIIMSMNQKLNKDETNTKLSNRKPVKLTNHILLRVLGHESEIDIDGSFRDFIQDRIIPLKEHAFIQNQRIDQYNKLDNQRGVAQLDKKSSASLFSKHLESQVSHILLGLNHPSANRRFLNSLEFQRSEKNVIGSSTKANNSSIKYKFNPVLDYAIESSEHTISQKKFIFEATYERRFDIVIPVVWSLKYYENGTLINTRSYKVESFNIGNTALPPRALTFPIDTYVIENDGDKVKYGRVSPEGSIIPIDRKERSVPIEDILAKDRSANRFRLLALALATIGVLGFVYFIYMSKQTKLKVSFSPLGRDKP